MQSGRTSFISSTNKNMDATATSKSLADVDAELEALELQLQTARERKAAIAREQERFREEQQLLKQQKQETGGADDLQRQIEELKLQLAKQELEVKRSSNQAVRNVATNASTEGYQQSPPIQEIQYPTENYEPVQGSSERAMQKHAWDKPAWALPSESIPDDSILKDSIQNPMLKAPTTTGYERKVHEANLALIPGKFVQPTKAKAVEPRMVWIVVNIDGSKIGKIVMHLYGNFIPLTDIFIELKGLELFNCNKNNGTLVITDIDPNFYIHTGTVATFTQHFPQLAKDACYGIVLEGQDIMNQILNAPLDAVLTVKQSHIYPVKKTK